ncbi:hypothetical protein ACFLYG_01895 [Chloroflexota bacterium]
MKRILLALMGLVLVTGILGGQTVWASVDDNIASGQLFASTLVKPGVPSTATIPSGARNLVRKSTGELWCVYFRVIDYTTQIFGSYSTDGGDNWIEEQISFGAGSQRNCSIAVDSQDNIHVAWQGMGWGNEISSYNIQYRKRTSSWQPQEAVTNKGDQQACPVIAIDDEDNVHVIWQGKGWNANPGFDNIQCRKRTDSWQTQEAVTDKNQHQRSPSVAIDGAGNVHVVWSGIGWGANSNIDNIQYRKRTDSWQAQENVSDKPDFQWAPCIAIDTNDNVHVVWYGDGWAPHVGDHQILYRKKVSSSWQLQEQLTAVNYAQNDPSIALDKDGNVYVVWSGLGWGTYPYNYNIQCRKRTDCWQEQESITDRNYNQRWGSLTYATHPSGVTMPASGCAFVWSGRDVNGFELEFYKSSDLSWDGSVVPPSIYTLNIGVSGNGTTNPAPGSWEYANGSQVTISAIPSADWVFDHWSGDVSGAVNPITITMDSSKNVTAYFSQTTNSGSIGVLLIKLEGVDLSSLPEGTEVTVNCDSSSATGIVIAVVDILD